MFITSILYYELRREKVSFYLFFWFRLAREGDDSAEMSGFSVGMLNISVRLLVFSVSFRINSVHLPLFSV